ncbi:MAG: hypothetical protein OXC26_02575 [Albidovulum sp.]|nr:hypothetical protein [Albidovulum sp.]
MYFNTNLTRTLFRVLVPLCWFGVKEWSEMQRMHDVRHWRKTGLFDRLLSFDGRAGTDRRGVRAATAGALHPRFDPIPTGNGGIW